MSIKKSFSLIEVLIFITILSIFLISSAAIITVSMRQNTLRINTLKATHYNEQLLDWIRNEKETEWNTFVINAGNNTYCFKDDAWSGWPSTGACASYDLAGMYKRYAIFATTVSGGVPTQVEVTVYTDWQEVGNSYSTKLHTIFTIWE